MNYHTILSTDILQRHMNDPRWAIIDCRFSLSDADYGRRAYLAGHIPGAVYCHLNEDLAGPVTPGKTGRHPLPAVEHLASVFSRLGIGPADQVVAYDDWPTPGGVAARLWWSLRWLGHDAVAVLDGGWQRWLALGLPQRSGVESRLPETFLPDPHPELVASAADIERMRRDAGCAVIDSRSYDRFLGENETIDPVAGHIPGAHSAPYMENTAADGLMVSPEMLRKRFEKLLAGIPVNNAAFYCGSGVTAAHNILALLHSGLGDGRLYPGSWSDWITDPAHPVASGEE
jgi:thiosulfate/3-mercaptopyruvate sulfurtransferase